MRVIIDTDALLGVFNPTDNHHSKAILITKRLVEKGIDTVILATTLAEFALLATSKMGLKETKQAIKTLKQFNITILEVREQTSQTALSIYNSQTSKEESLFDCFIMAAAKLQRMDAIFSFDKGYKKVKNQDLKLKLVSDLFQNLN